MKSNYQKLRELHAMVEELANADLLPEGHKLYRAITRLSPDRDEHDKSKSTARALRRAQQIIDDADDWRFARDVELNGMGADTNDNNDYVELRRLQRILIRSFKTPKN